MRPCSLQMLMCAMLLYFRAPSPAAAGFTQSGEGGEKVKRGAGSPVEIALSESMMTSQNYPNPFNPSTQIEYRIESASQVSLKVYNLLGQEVATLVNQHQEAGRYTLTFNAINLSSGVYFYRLETGSSVSIKRLVLIR